MTVARRRGGRAARLSARRTAGTIGHHDTAARVASDDRGAGPLPTVGLRNEPDETDASGFHRDRVGAKLDGEDGPRGSGAERASSSRLLVIACGALAREILRLQTLNGWDHLDLVCLPASLHNRPERITPLVADAVRRHRTHYARIFVAYADCGTGGLLAAACADLGVEMLPGPHCYALYSGLSRFAGQDETTSFFLTDFLARQFETLIWRGLGLDRYPGLRDAYFGNYQRLVYLAQTNDPALDRCARAGAERLGLAYERRFTGFGDLETVLASA